MNDPRERGRSGGLADREGIDMTKARAKTANELRDDFMGQCRALVDYWATVPDGTPREQLTGLLHSILCIIDGSSGGFPVALDLVCRPHPDDKAYLQAEGEDWVEDGTVLNADDMLHELLYARPEATR